MFEPIDADDPFAVRDECLVARYHELASGNPGESAGATCLVQRQKLVRSGGIVLAGGQDGLEPATENPADLTLMDNEKAGHQKPIA